jgi:class 3 adenylate cyclase
MGESSSMFRLLSQVAEPKAATAIERFVADAPDHRLVRVNALAFAANQKLDEEAVIAAFLHAAKIGIFDMSWNVLCPACGGVLDSNTTLKTVRSDEYVCSLCAEGYEPTLDEMVEVTFTVTSRVRPVPGHNPNELSPLEYLRQFFFGSQMDLPEDLEEVFEDILLEALELPAGEKAIVSLQLKEGLYILNDPVSHTVQFISARGERTRERQTLSFTIDTDRVQYPKAEIQPGPLRISIENRLDRRALPMVLAADDPLRRIMNNRRAFLTAKRLLSNQTFRDIHRTDTLDIDQRLKITSLTFLFTDLRGSTALYERVGDLAAFDLVKAHFNVLNQIVASEAGAVVKTIGDAVMATFSTPDRAVSAAIRMREAMRKLNEGREREELLLKIGIHEGPCIAVNLNERQDYFGQTVNIASRVQGLATSHHIFATSCVVEDARVSGMLQSNGLQPMQHQAKLRGIASEMNVYAIP